MQPDVFTLVLRHPTTASAIVENVGLHDIAGIALGASPCAEVFICPAQYLDSFRSAQEIIDRAKHLVKATACPGGFKVLAGNTPWTQEVFRALDCTARADRAAKRKARTPCPARALDILNHHRDAPLFTLEQRAHLVAP